MDSVYRMVNELKLKYATKDPIELSKELGCHIYYRDFKNLLGMYSMVLDRRCIFVKNDLDDNRKKMVIAHELGHDQLHREMGTQKSFILTDMRTRAEYEANIFASHLLIDDEDVIRLVEEGYDIVQISQILNVNINLCLIKINEMVKIGYNFNRQIQPNANFLKDI